MAEYIAGSESGFVQMMNERAASLGMENTHFEDCCGLTDSDNHYTTARDIATYGAGADNTLSADKIIYDDLDGKYYPCNNAGKQGIWTCQYQ